MSQNPLLQLSSWLASAKNVVAFTGAGISTPSGIPDFRSEKSGLWQGIDAMEVASIYGFRKDPKQFFDWVFPLAEKTLKAIPNPAHLALAELERAGKLSALITQNIDMLHTKAGNKVIHELHGHMREATCIQCFKVYDGESVMRTFLENEQVPHCPSCGGVLKPNVILFGEQLPYEPLQQARRAAKACDLMLVIGSSLEVAPASDMPLIAARSGAKVVIINLEPTAMDGYVDLVIQGDAAEILPAVVQSMQMFA